MIDDEESFEYGGEVADEFDISGALSFSAFSSTNRPSFKPVLVPDV